MLMRICLLAIASFALAACDIGEITRVEEINWQGPADAPADWDAVLAEPVDLRVTAYITGEVEAGAGILIDPDVEGVPAAYQDDIWVPAVSYLVEHPSGRTLLMDAGLKAGDCGYSILLVINLGCRNVVGQDVVTQLAGEEPKRIDYLMVSHFHGDHVSNLPAVLAAYDPVVLTTDAELAAVESAMRETSGYKREHVRADMRVQTIDAGLIEMPVLGKAANVFGDGSVWLVPTPGHTPGHLSALLNTSEGPKLLTFDAAHLAATYAFNAPGSLSYDVDLGRDSINRMKAFVEAYPQTQVIYGHEPAQWVDRGIRNTLFTSRADQSETNTQGDR